MRAQLRETPKSFPHEFFSESTVALGKSFTPKLEPIPKELGGFPLHARGMWVTIVLSVTTVAANMTALMYGYKLFGAFRLLFQVGSHKFIPDLSGVHVYHDSRRMSPHHPMYAAPADLADADTAGVAVTLRMYVPFSLPASADGAEYDGSIPVCMLRDGDLVLTTGSGSDLNHAGVSYTFTSIKLAFELDPLAKIRVPTAWAIRRADAASEKSLLFQPSGFLYYASLFDPTLVTPLIDSALYGRIETTIGSGQLRSNTVEELQNQYAVAVCRATGLPLSVAASALSITAPDSLDLVRPYWYDLVTRQPRGAVKVGLPDKSGSLAQYAVVYRERGTRFDNFRKEAYGRLGVKGSPSEITVEARASKKRAPDWLVPHLDEVIYWPGQPFAGVAAP